MPRFGIRIATETTRLAEATRQPKRSRRRCRLKHSTQRWLLLAKARENLGKLPFPHTVSASGYNKRSTGKLGSRWSVYRENGGPEWI